MLEGQVVKRIYSTMGDIVGGGIEGYMDFSAPKTIVVEFESGYRLDAIAQNYDGEICLDLRIRS